MRETGRPPVDGGIVLVTGASAGIGREFALQLAARAGTLAFFPRQGRLRTKSLPFPAISNIAEGFDRWIRFAKAAPY